MMRRELLTLAGGLLTLSAVDNAEATEGDLSPEISDGEDYTQAAFSEVETSAPVGEIFAVPNEARFEIKGIREEGSGQFVDVSISTDRTSCAINLKCVFDPEEARQIAQRLQAAAAVAELDN